MMKKLFLSETALTKQKVRKKIQMEKSKIPRWLITAYV
jgi:hypothetical protein